MMASRLGLPVTLTNNGARFILEKLRPQHLPEAEVILEQCLQDGQGVGKDEQVPFQALHRPPGPGQVTLGVVAQEDDSLVAVAPIHPCGVARSSQPIVCGMHCILRRDYRGQALFGTITPEAYKVTVRMGYVGVVTRTSSPSATVALRAAGLRTTGHIPESLLLEGRGRLDDTVLSNSLGDYSPDLYKERIKELVGAKQHIQIPEIDTETFPPDHLQQEDFPLDIPPPNLTPAVTLRAAAVTDLLEVERLIRDAAIHGDGFALDEFEDGVFNRKLFWRCSTIVAISASSGSNGPAILGAALFGPTKLCRSESTKSMAVYIIVEAGSRRQGLGNALLDSVEVIARQRGFRALLTDVLVDNKAGHLMTSRAGFLCTGCINNSAFTKHSGFTDSLIYHKYLNPLIPTSAL